MFWNMKQLHFWKQAERGDHRAVWAQEGGYGFASISLLPAVIYQNQDEESRGHGVRNGR